MRLPAELLDAIQRETDRVDRRSLVHAAAQLAECYKAADFSSPAITTEAHRAAYLAVRLPATYGALRRVFSEVLLRGRPNSGIAGRVLLWGGLAAIVILVWWLGRIAKRALREEIGPDSTAA